MRGQVNDAPVAAVEPAFQLGLGRLGLGEQCDRLIGEGLDEEVAGLLGFGAGARQRLEAGELGHHGHSGRGSIQRGGTPGSV